MLDSSQEMETSHYLVVDVTVVLLKTKILNELLFFILQQGPCLRPKLCGVDQVLVLDDANRS